MIPAVPLNAQDRLRRTKSTRSIRKNQPLDSEIDKYHATAAASYAMLHSNGRSSMDSRSSYDRLGGPGSVAVPQRQYPSSIRHADDNSSIGRGSTLMYPSLSHQSSAGSVEAQDHYQTVSAALPPISEFQGLDGRDSSIPSSYRRLRKSRSMFAPRQRHSHISYTSEHNVGGAGSDFSQSDTPQSYGTLRRSMSFLRGGSQPSRTVRHSKSHDAAIDLARSQFLNDSGGQGSQRRHSSLLPKREHKPFRKTFRTVSEPGLDAASMPPWLEHSKNGGLHGKARSLSHSIRNGIKRLLRFSRPSDTSTDVHGLSNSRYSWDNNGESVGSATDTDYPFNSSEPRDSSLDDTASHSRQPTIRSARSSESLCTSNSRVTSWADSTAANTVATGKAANRLSIIEEHGNANRKLSQLTPNNSPSRSSHVTSRPGSHRPNGPYDSQRVYSALVKRIEREKEGNPDEEIVFGTVKEHHPVPERASSVYSHRSKRTIRRVPSEESVNSPRSFATAKGATPSVRRQSSKMSRVRQEDTNTPSAHRSPSYADGQHQHQTGHTLPGKRSRYFMTRDSFNNPSPDGGGMVRPCERGEGSGDDDDDDDTGRLTEGQGNSNEESDSPSVYSRTTSGNTPTNDVLADPLESEEEPGMVTIFESQRSPYNSPRKMANSSSSASVTASLPSADWQQWVNSQMARIEELTPTRREHYREESQIHDDEDDSIISAISADTIRPGNGEDTGKGLNRKLSTSSKVSARSNFSRPFTRTPSVRTVVSPMKLSASAAIPSSTFLSPSRDDNNNNVAVNSVGQSFRVPAAFENNNSPSPSPMRTRFDSTFRLPESPTPKREAASIQRLWANDSCRRYPSRRPPVAQDTKASQFRSIRASRSNARLTNENIKMEDRGSDGGVTEENTKPRDIHSTVSSKRMVDMFLDSRRQMGSEAPEGNASGPVFL